MTDVTDPVCQMSFPEEEAEELGAEKATHAGHTYWFCCRTCKDEFLNAPETYSRRAPPTS